MNRSTLTIFSLFMIGVGSAVLLLAITEKDNEVYEKRAAEKERRLEAQDKCFALTGKSQCMCLERLSVKQAQYLYDWDNGPLVDATRRCWERVK